MRADLSTLGGLTLARRHIGANEMAHLSQGVSLESEKHLANSILSTARGEALRLLNTIYGRFFHAYVVKFMAPPRPGTPRNRF